MTASFEIQHSAMLLKYSGISFISGAVNHGFFSGERSLWTAAIGIVLFVVGAWMDTAVKTATTVCLNHSGSALYCPLGWDFLPADYSTFLTHPQEVLGWYLWALRYLFLL